MVDVTGVKIVVACLSAMKETKNTFEVEGLWKGSTLRTQSNQMINSDHQKALKQEKTNSSNAMHKFSPKK